MSQKTSIKQYSGHKEIKSPKYCEGCYSRRTTKTRILTFILYNKENKNQKVTIKWELDVKVSNILYYF